MSKATRYYRCLYFSFPLALAALLLFCLLPCPPVIAAPVLMLSASSGPVGSSVTITGAVFDSYEGDSIHILFDTTEIENSPITIPSGGSFTVTWVVSADAAPGMHNIGAKGEKTGSSFFITAPFTVDARQLSLTTNQGPVGTDLNITGSGFYVNEGVTISYANPAAGDIGAITASSSGKFSRSYKIPAGTAGIHKFTASNARGNTAETAFKVLPAIVLSVDSGAPGEIVNVRGSGFGLRSGVNIFLDTLGVAVATADDYGSFEIEFTIPAITLSTHYLKARDGLNNKAEIVFPVTAGATLSENTGAVGNLVVVNGSGFQSASNVTVFYDDTLVASGITDNFGKFTVTFNVPASMGGVHTIRIGDSITTRRYSYTVETAAPPPPFLLSPVQKDITSAYTAFQWQPVSDPSMPVTYNLEISPERDFSNVILHKEGITGSQYTLAGEEALSAEPPISVYYWRIMAIDGAGNRSGWSEIWSCYVGVPGGPPPLLPPDGSTVIFPFSFSWSPSASLSGPVTYNLQVSRNSEFSELLIDEKGITSSAYTIPLESKRIFNKKIPYYWRVKAVDNARNTSEWSATGSFNIASTGFPAWAAWTLAGLGAVILALLVLRFRKRTAYH